LLRARSVLAKVRSADDEDFNMGVDILSDALGQPVQAIARNAGFDGAIVAHKIEREKSAAYGFDALKGEYCDMLAAGIVDPAKVTKAALQNAVSVATLLLTTDALIANLPEKEKGGGGGGGGMDGMDGMDGMGGMGGGMDF